MSVFLRIYEAYGERAQLCHLCVFVCERQSAIIAVQGVDSTGMCSNMPSN